MEYQKERVRKFEPYIFRDLRNPITSLEAKLLVLLATKSCIFGVPSDFRNMGMVCALVYTTISSCVVIHLCQIIFRGMHVMCCRKLKGHMTYQLALSEAINDKITCCFWVRYVAHFLIACSLWTYHFAMICYDYMIVCELVGDNVLNLERGSELATTYAKTIVLIPHIIVFSLGRLKNLGFASFMALVYFFIYYIVGELYSMQTYTHYVSENTYKKYINYSFFPLAIPSSFISSTLAVGVFLFIEQDCEIPRNFVKPFGVLNTCLIISTVLHMIVGATGYAVHGVNSKYKSYLFTDLTVGKAIILGNAFRVIITFAIHGYCVEKILWNEIAQKFIKKRSNYYFYEMILRFGICLVVYAICLFMEKDIFASVVEIIKGISVPIFGFFGPVTLDILTRDSFGPMKVILFSNFILLCCSLFYGYIQVSNNLDAINRLIALDSY